jgi:hypothetical protein
MKLRIATLSLTFHYLPTPITGQTCTSLAGSFTLSDITGACTYETLLEEYTRQVFDVAGSTCTSSTFTAKDDLDAKLMAATNAASGEEGAVVVCKAMYDGADITPFTKAADKGTDLHFEQMFYNGLSDWQEEIETVYESDDLNTPTSVLREDAAKVREFYHGDGSYSRVSWPNSLTNFRDETCDSHAAMCCWPKDRQANDGNGNCAKPYDENCVDKDPADNTNLIFADLAKGNLSSEFDSSNGFMVFPGDNGDGEGAIHCHGFAWAEDEYDPISRYKANNLFFVSMYDHMHQRGYVKNIPGMPMCGCMEQMPMATRSDCTQVDLTEDWRMEFDATTGKFTGVLEKVEVDFNACQGRGGRNNDLWAYAARLYDEGRLSRHRFGVVGRVLTDDHDVYHYVENAKAEKGLITSYTHDESKWTLVAGRDNMKVGEPWQREAFNTAFFEQNLDGASVIMRICPDCVDTHKRVFYRRLSGRPTDPNFDILHDILYRVPDSSSNVGGGDNTWGEDFSLHSTYQDAVDGTNAWACPDNAFNYRKPFYGNCSPDGTKVTEQYTVFSWYPGPRPNVAYYVNSPENTGIQDYMDNTALTRTTGMTDMDIAAVDGGLEGNTLENNGTYHIYGAGEDIWHTSDEFHYKSQPYSGDIDVSVHLSSFSNPGGDGWAKMGIMLRSDNSPDATYAFNLMNGAGQICPQHRRSKGNGAGSSGNCYSESPALSSTWLRIVKKQETVEFYRGDGSPEGWVLQYTDSFFFPEDQYRVGLAVTSNRRDYLTEATFEDYSINEYIFPTSAPSLSSAPTPWTPLVDINTQRAGEFAGDDSSFTIKGSGTGIWGTTDSFMFYNTQVLDSAFSSVEMKIDSFGSGQIHARAGLMIRDTNDEGAANVFVGAGGARTGAYFQSRSLASAETVHHKAIYVNYQNTMWVKLTKSGDVVTAYYKENDVDEYIEMGSVTLQGLNGSSLQVGRAVSAGTDYTWALEAMYGSSYSVV